MNLLTLDTPVPHLMSDTASLPCPPILCKCFVYDLEMHLGRVGVWQGGYGPWQSTTDR